MAVGAHDQQIDRGVTHVVDQRFGGTAEFIDLVARIRQLDPAAGIRSNVIVGFPGETEEEFEELLGFLQEARLDAIGVFGYSFLDQNNDKIKGANIEGVVPTFENIQSGKYKVARPMFIYVKSNHVGSIPGISASVVGAMAVPAM